MPSPEELAREKIDALLQQSRWILQNRSTINLSASRGVAIREALLKERDEVDYLLFVDGKAIGTVEAKPEGYTLTLRAVNPFQSLMSFDCGIYQISTSKWT